MQGSLSFLERGAFDQIEIGSMAIYTYIVFDNQAGIRKLPVPSNVKLGSDVYS